MADWSTEIRENTTFTSGDQRFWELSEEQLEQTYDDIDVLPFITA